MAAHSVFLPGESHGQRSLGGAAVKSLGAAVHGVTQSQTRLSNIARTFLIYTAPPCLCCDALLSEVFSSQLSSAL